VASAAIFSARALFYYFPVPAWPLRNCCFSVLVALRAPCLRECAHRANLSRTPGFAYFPRYVHHVFGNVRTMSSGVCAPFKIFFRSLAFPYFSRYGHHVFGSARTWQLLRGTPAFLYFSRCVHHVFASVRTWQMSQELLVFHFLRVTYTMSSGVCAPFKIFLRSLPFPYFSRCVHHVFGSVRTMSSGVCAP